MSSGHDETSPVGTPNTSILDGRISKALDERGFKSGGSDGRGGDGMDVRVGKLEVHMQHMQGDLTEIKGLLSVIHDLPTKRDLTTNLAVIVSIGIAAIAIVIGGIIGGLAYIQPAPSPPSAPVLYQIQPVSPQATTPLAPATPPSKASGAANTH